MAYNANNLSTLFPKGTQVTVSAADGFYSGKVDFADVLGICIQWAEVTLYFPWSAVDYVRPEVAR